MLLQFPDVVGHMLLPPGGAQAMSELIAAISTALARSAAPTISTAPELARSVPGAVDRSGDDTEKGIEPFEPDPQLATAT
jgi:hypothetical protein